jgi:hypothetical protein
MTVYTKPAPDARAIGTMVDTETLRIMADWKQDLRIRYERAQLVWELIGGNGPEIEAIGAEMQAFADVCRTLKGVIHA